MALNIHYLIDKTKPGNVVVGGIYALSTVEEFEEIIRKIAEYNKVFPEQVALVKINPMTVE